jgi:hypothetical protein
VVADNPYPCASFAGSCSARANWAINVMAAWVKGDARPPPDRPVGWGCIAELKGASDGVRTWAGGETTASEWLSDPRGCWWRAGLRYLSAAGTALS